MRLPFAPSDRRRVQFAERYLASHDIATFSVVGQFEITGATIDGSADRRDDTGGAGAVGIVTDVDPIGCDILAGDGMIATVAPTGGGIVGEPEKTGNGPLGDVEGMDGNACSRVSSAVRRASYFTFWLLSSHHMSSTATMVVIKIASRIVNLNIIGLPRQVLSDRPL
jgi:hypothetical protein